MNLIRKESKKATDTSIYHATKR